jgi:hypothetical protein
MTVRKRTCPYCSKKNVDGRHTASCPQRPEAVKDNEYIYNTGLDDPANIGQDVNNIDQVVDNDNPLSISKKPVITGENEPENRTAGRPPGSRNKGDIFKKFQHEIDAELLKLCLGKPESITCPACKHKFERVGKPDREALIHVDNRLKGKVSTTSGDPAAKGLELSNSELIKISLSVLEQIAQYNALPTDGLIAQVAALPPNNTAIKASNSTVIETTDTAQVIV